MITSIARRDSQRKQSNFMQPKQQWLQDIFIITAQCIEISSQRTSQWMRQGISTLQILVYQNSCNHKLNKPIHFVGQQSIQLQKFLTKRAMVLQWTGGPLVYLYMKWLLVDLPSCIKTIINWVCLLGVEILCFLIQKDIKYS